MIRKFVFIILFSGFKLVTAQTNTLYPDFVKHFTSQMNWVNPGYTEPDAQISLNTIHALTSGNRGKVGLRIFDVSFKVSHDSLTVNHTLKVLVSNELEGPYIQRPRLYGNYAISIPLSWDKSLYAGTSFGFAGSYIDASGVSAATNYTVPDGSIGLGFRSSRLDVGAAMQHVFNQRINSNVLAQQLKRYYHFHALYKVVLDEKFTLQPAVFIRYFRDIPVQVNGSISVNYFDRIQLGIQVQNQAGVTIVSSVQAPLRQSVLHLLFAYNSGLFSASPVFFRGYEIGARLLI